MNQIKENRDVGEKNKPEAYKNIRLTSFHSCQSGSGSEPCRGDPPGLAICGTAAQQQRLAQEGRALTPSAPLSCHGPWLVMPGTGSITVLGAGNLTLEVVSGLCEWEGSAPKYEDAWHLNSHGGWWAKVSL